MAVTPSVTNRYISPVTLPMVAKQKMQSVSFRNVEEFLDYLPDEEREITVLLRKIVFSCHPEITEKLSYNVPYYRLHKQLCFIWPAAILWGKKKNYEGVRFGFTSGHLLTDEIGYLDKGSRKFVCYKDFRRLKEIDAELLRSYIFEAMAIDEISSKKIK
ncbi:MAG TPA: DUF1801 domain-containing protein [Sediminibacterium sp.]